MATLRPDWSRSSIKKLVARLRAPGGGVGVVYTRKRSFTAFSSAQLDELKAELPTLPRVSVNVVAKKLGTSRSTAWRVLHDKLEKKPYKPIRAQRITSATVLRRLAFCRLIRLRLGARVRLCKGPSLPTLNLQYSSRYSVNFRTGRCCTSLLTCGTKNSIVSFECRCRL